MMIGYEIVAQVRIAQLREEAESARRVERVVKIRRAERRLKRARLRLATAKLHAA